MFFISFSFTALFLMASQVSSEYLRGCYFTNWAHYRQGIGKYEPEDYVPGLCTHIFFAFGKIDSYTMNVVNFDAYDLPSKGGYYARVNALKERQENLKVLLSLGGWNAGTAIFKEVASSSSNRKKFAESAIKFINQYGFDGLDIDWEYPDADDKANFVELLKELKAVSNGKLLTIAVAGAPQKIDAGYDIPAIVPSVDIVNVMTYDYHGSWEQVIGQNSPLFSLPNDTTNFNTAASMKYWADKGMPKHKLLVGIGTYGRGWTLSDPSKCDIGSPGTAAPSRPFTNAQGLAAYYEICALGGNRYWDDIQKVPYMLKNDLWYGYDDVQSVKNKMNWLKDNGFGGAFVWALDMDDFRGEYSGGKKYPLLNAIKEELSVTSNSHNPESSKLYETKPMITERPAPEPTDIDNASKTTRNDFVCPGDGLFRNPSDCTTFYSCANGISHLMKCPPGLEWNDNAKVCDWPAKTKD